MDKAFYKNKKLHFLEGMRALMAFNVILCHFCSVYYPQMMTKAAAENANNFLSIFATTPLSVTINGNIAVVYFMALTGFLVGMSTFTKPKLSTKELFRKSFLRYTRLLPIVLIATLFTYITMICNLQKHLLITDPQADLDHISRYCNFDPTIPSLINNIFIKPFIIDSDYIGPFWTIKYEFIGYILVLFASTILQNLRWRRILYILIGIAAPLICFVINRSLDIHYTIFMIGLLVADLEYNTNETILSKYYNKFLDSKVYIVVCLILGIYLSCCPMFSTPLYSLLLKIPGVSGTLIRGIGICLFIIVLLKTKYLQRILSWKPLLVLGKCSFETYALHWPLMMTVEAALFLAFRQSLSYDVSALLAFVISLPVFYASSLGLNYFINYTKHRRNNKT
ncbi:MAG: acyltransferase [Clostridiales bacterium]|nr:acyltransferase [Clostridiales bacterium]